MLPALIIMAPTVWIAFSIIRAAVAFVFVITSSVTTAISFMTTAFTVAARKLLYFPHDFSKQSITSSDIRI